MLSGDQSGKLLAIAVKPVSRAPMVTYESVDVTPERGLTGDCSGTSPRRQVTVLSQEAWATVCGELQTELSWTTRRANLLIDGVTLERTAGRRLRIGELLLEITGETAPCSRMEEAHVGLRASLRPAWRGGVTCRVLEGATISIGDPVIFET